MTPADAPNFTPRGLAVALGGKIPKSRVWHPEFEAKNRKPDKGAPVSPYKCRSDHGPRKASVPARTWPSSRILLSRVSKVLATKQATPASFTWRLSDTGVSAWKVKTGPAVLSPKPQPWRHGRDCEARHRRRHTSCASSRRVCA